MTSLHTMMDILHDISEIDEDLSLAEEMYYRQKKDQEEEALGAAMHEEAPLGANVTALQDQPHEKWM